MASNERTNTLIGVFLHPENMPSHPVLVWDTQNRQGIPMGEARMGEDIRSIASRVIKKETGLKNPRVLVTEASRLATVVNGSSKMEIVIVAELPTFVNDTRTLWNVRSNSKDIVQAGIYPSEHLPSLIENPEIVRRPDDTIPILLWWIARMENKYHGDYLNRWLEKRGYSYDITRDKTGEWIYDPLKLNELVGTRV
ncbi:hypothetical protein A2872_03595 [Candidatus Gottesmanbacteria bacterium RIFCSPHIGHO2_01_FULL_42_12]|uniref:Nudix hydrolase domain-containing protein n=1 Tax=Candidatus Gottesmanbacteria bacterium RIFCSPHIGHO2_01_FULL_42_12 TaxID=1798377 RepID=A0A1F5Z5B7_9BACT|nr:MAG: hypothetical protein A2872_03595 [Candidatus Gottesmanbacteria bacterium RIFCSPHIGHO2_01_FULL_42_12]